jgi:hypothetical protein
MHPTLLPPEEGLPPTEGLPPADRIPPAGKFRQPTLRAANVCTTSSGLLIHRSQPTKPDTPAHRQQEHKQHTALLRKTGCAAHTHLSAASPDLTSRRKRGCAGHSHLPAGSLDNRPCRALTCPRPRRTLLHRSSPFGRHRTEKSQHLSPPDQPRNAPAHRISSLRVGGDVATPTYQRISFISPQTALSPRQHSYCLAPASAALHKQPFPASQANPKFELRAETYAKRKSTSACLLPIPAFDRNGGLNNRHLKSNRGICLR